MQVKLENIAEIRAGHPFRGAIKESNDGNGYVIQTRDQSEDGVIDWSELVYTQITGRNEPEWLKQGDIIFSARGLRNLASSIPDLDRAIVCSPHYFVISVLPHHVIPEFLAWQLNQTIAQRYFQQSAEGSAQRTIRRAILENTPISVPSIEMQERMIKMVQAVEREEIIYKKLIELRQSELQAIAQRILSGKNI